MSNTNLPTTVPIVSSAPAAIAEPSVSFSIPPVVIKTLKHFAILGGLAAAGAIATGLIVFLNGVNIATLPVTYQVFVGVLIPLIVAAIKNAQTEIANELAAEQAKNNLLAAQATAANLQAKLAELSVPIAKVSKKSKDNN